MLPVYQPVPARSAASTARRRGRCSGGWAAGRRAFLWATATSLLVALMAGWQFLGGRRWMPEPSFKPLVDLARFHAALLAGLSESESPAPAEPPLLPAESPWLSPQALEVPPTPSHLRRPHVRVVIRVHHATAHLARGLLEQLRHQATAAGALATVDFALVATEPRGLKLTQTLAAETWAQGDLGRIRRASVRGVLDGGPTEGAGVPLHGRRAGAAHSGLRPRGKASHMRLRQYAVLPGDGRRCA